MPFPTQSAFPRLLRDFSRHWTALNASFAPEAPLLVLENLPVSTLATLGEALAEVEAGFGPRSVESKLARAAARSAVEPLRRLTRHFNRWARGNCYSLPAVLALAHVVGPGVAMDRVRAMARVTLHLWERIASGPPVPHAAPTKQAFGAEVADLAAALEAMEAAEDARTDAELDEALLLAEAVLLRREIVAVATAYGHAVQGRLREGDPRRASLPELWHPGGRTPRGA